MLRAKFEPVARSLPEPRTRLLLSGHALTPLPAGAMFWEAESTLIVADLHLEKGAAFARVARRGEMIRRKCFATDGYRLVMPAFGAYTGGLNVLGEAFEALFLRRTLEAWMLGKSEVYPIGARALLPD